MPQKGFRKFPKYICRDCGQDKSYLKKKSYLCSTCYWKRKYFGGLYWDVIERDNGLCIICGKLGKNVHHKNHDPKDNRLKNLETLCVTCHAQKRKMVCVDCKKETIANGAHQIRCKSCGKKHEKIMSYKRQAKYWKTRNRIRYKWYINALRKLE